MSYEIVKQLVDALLSQKPNLTISIQDAKPLIEYNINFDWFLDRYPDKIIVSHWSADVYATALLNIKDDMPYWEFRISDGESISCFGGFIPSSDEWLHDLQYRYPTELHKELWILNQMREDFFYLMVKAKELAKGE